METLILGAFEAISLTAAVAPAANAAIFGTPGTSYHSGPYEKTGSSPDGPWLNGGGG